MDNARYLWALARLDVRAGRRRGSAAAVSRRKRARRPRRLFSESKFRLALAENVSAFRTSPGKRAMTRESDKRPSSFTGGIGA